MVKTKMGVLAAACCALSFGCADPTATDQETSPVGANGGSNGGQPATNGPGGAAGTNTGNGGTNTGNGGTNATNPETDSGAGSSAGSDAGESAGATTGAEDGLGDETAGGVACGNGPSCTGGQKCCASGFGATACKDSCGFGDTHAVCDGPEDCGTGKLCCSYIMKSYCAADCGGDFVSCHTIDQCPSSAAECRPNIAFPIWGICD